MMRAKGFHYSKAWGQNFLVDKNVLEKVAQAAELSAADRVVEIGPGAGALTVLLAGQAGHVTAVEIDGRLIPMLKEVTEGLENVDIVHDDFLKFKETMYIRDTNALPLTPSSHCEEPQPSTVMRRSNPEESGKSESSLSRYKLVGNLPYYITTPIIAGMFETGADGLRPAPPELAAFMVQKEVAERLTSPPGKKAYGAISVLVQYYADVEILSTVSREVFVPRPNVDSAVIRLKPKDLSGDEAETAARMFRLVRAGFDMRRKTLRNSLVRAGFPAEDLASALAQANIDPGRRAETLSPRDFYALATYLT